MGWPGPMTATQYWAWQDWLEDDMDRPSRADWYVMKLVETLRCHALKDWDSYDVDSQRMKFTTKDSGSKPQVKDPETGIVDDPYADETDEEREERYRRQMGGIIGGLGGV